jgi:Leucine-rich repeat (LRR) protein
LNHTELKEFPEIIRYDIKFHNLKYLFISDSCVSELIDLSFLNKLIVLDASNNNISIIPKLPDSIEELIIKNNKIENENLGAYTHLKRLDISNNKLRRLSVINSLKILVCDDNNLKQIKSYPKLKKLSCERNSIEEIKVSPCLSILECEHNKLVIIENFPNLKWLYCSYNDITCMQQLPKINVIYCMYNKLNTITYFSTLKELACDYNNKLSISNYYGILSSNIYSNYVIVLFGK